MGLDIDLIEVAGSCLLFCLVFCMSATVDIGCLMAQVKNRRAIATGLFLQFVVLPFLGFLVVRTLNMSYAMGITLLVVTSSPGGSYSNWWCSMFNADLALSVTMTAISTVLSVIALPVNLLIYARLSYNADVIASLDWTALFVSLAIVLTAIGLGLWASERLNSHNFNLHANRLGNVAGISLVIFSAVMSNSDEDSQLWERPWRFYFGVAAPCVLGLLIANLMTTGFELLRPERVTVSIECCYQNVGIATSVALTMFDGADLAEAVGVPFYYGMVEAFILGIYCVVAWKAGWTKAPSDINFWKAITTSYEILSAEKAENDDDIVMVEKPDAPGGGGDDGFHYVSHAEAGLAPNNNKTDNKTDKADNNDPRRASLLAAASVRRHPRDQRDRKEPSFVVA